MSIVARTTNRGERRYDVRLRRPDGSVYTRTFRTRKDAEAWERAERSAQDTGTWVDPRAGTVTVGDYAQTWLANRTVRGKPLAARTAESYGYLLRHFVLPKFGSVALSKLRPHDVRDWHGQLVRSGPPSVAAKAYRLLHAICATAVDDGLLVANPCRVKAAGGEIRAERPLLGPAEVQALADAIDPRFSAMVLLAGYGALRFGELVGLRRRDVDLLHGQIVIDSQLVELSSGRNVRTNPKSAAGRRRVTLPPFVVTALEQHLATWVEAAPDAPLFTGARGGVPSRTNWARAWADARTAAGLPDTVHLHDLRHAGATMAAQVGATTKELMARLGHASPRAALIYQHAADHRDREIAEGLEALHRRLDPERTSTDGPARAMDARWHPQNSTKAGSESRPQPR